MDILANWLTPTVGRLLKIDVARAAEPWGVSIDARDTVILRVMLNGGAWVSVSGYDPFRFEVGDVLLARAVPHELLSDLDEPTEPIEEFSRNMPSRTDPFTSQFICAAFGTEFAQSSLPPLPPVLHIQARDVSANPRFAAIMTAVREECDSPGSGSDVMISRLMEALLLCAVRESFLRCGNGQTPKSTRDPAVTKALELMRDNFDRRWTVEDLAKNVGVSRAVFARRFTQDLSMSPLTYLSTWRLKVAARYLANNNAGLAQIAMAIGYQSESAFSRAFKREFGIAPDEFRKLGSTILKSVDTLSSVKRAAEHASNPSVA